MKKAVLLFAVVASFVAGAHGGDVRSIYYTDDTKYPIDFTVQQQLRATNVWQQFLSRNGDWYISFNEATGMPHRAYGSPLYIPYLGSFESTARFFLDTELKGFALQNSDLHHVNTRSSENHHFVDFEQIWNGLRVLDSRVTVKFTPQVEVILFGLDYFHQIDVDINPQLTPSQAAERAVTDLSHVHDVRLTEELAVLPVRSATGYTYHLIYEAFVAAEDEEGVPQQWQVYIDAKDGAILYRRNRVDHFVNVNGDVKMDHPLGVDVNQGMSYIRATVNGTNYSADVNGDIDFASTGSISALFRMQSDWVNVKNGGITPTYSTTIPGGQTSININPGFSLVERTVFYHTNVVHDVMKGFLPNFTSLDVSLTANVELTSGNCNAFYDGSSINFYTQAGGCYSLGLIPDVVYHEYGHGITNRFYQANGTSFQNGAMGEGYSDTWAIYITGNPIVGFNYEVGNPGTYIRRYDQNPKVYPQDIVGQVHSDGEIIAGAWYDAGLYLNDATYMMYLNAQGMYGLPNGPDGSEGQVYTDILIEALQVDDAPSNGGDNDITNGTPNGADIVQGFADHGITLLSNASLAHIDVKEANSGAPVTIDASIILQYPWALSGANLYYDVNNTGSYTTTSLVNTSGNQYEADITGLATGDVVSYYLALEDNNGVLTNVTPMGAHLTANKNLPYFITVDFSRQLIEDFDTQQGNWLEGVPGDNATTGLWTIDVPMASFSDPSDPNSYVQPGFQTTPNGIACAVTGNAGSTSDGIGVNDVDGGKTTLQTPTFDLTGYSNPVFTYQRWYINNPPSGANPGADWWQVRISNDLVNWVDVESTLFADPSWRRGVLRVSDYVQPSATVAMQFIASDSTRLGQYLDGGSLIEAAMDDLEILDEVQVGLSEDQLNSVVVFPNPASSEFTVKLYTKSTEDISLEVRDLAGRLILNDAYHPYAGNQTLSIPVVEWAEGIYFVQLEQGSKRVIRKIQVQR